MYIFIIKEIREQKEITQEELSKRSGISRNYIAELENNKKINPSFETIYKISTALGVEIRQIYVASSDIENLRKLLHKSINEKGINSKETLRISHLLDKLINLKMEENGK